MTDAILADLLGSGPVARRRVERGYTPAERWVVELEDGRSVVVKAAVNELTAGWLRDEHRMYAALDAPFMPRLLGWADGARPLLILEDLSDALWPPPWNDQRVASVLRMLGDVAATPPPSWLPGARSSGFLERGWREVRGPGRAGNWACRCHSRCCGPRAGTAAAWPYYGRPPAGWAHEEDD